MSNVTKEGIEVRAGQVWRDLDKRENGRTVTVISVLDGRARAIGARECQISVRRMCRPYWALVRQPA